jgi:hypothetical protein
MKLTVALSALSFASLASAAIRNIRDLEGRSTLKVVPNTYIVELSSAANINEFERRRRSHDSSLERRHELFYRDLEDRAIHYKVRREWSSDVLTGVSLTLNVCDKSQ